MQDYNPNYVVDGEPLINNKGNLLVYKIDNTL